jgi:AcrR family transcriptional regulator
MAVADRRARHRASLRREILQAAGRLFAREGPEGVTMRRLADEIEYSPTTIYLHFTNKRDLLAAVCDETFSQFTATLERHRANAAHPVARLRDTLRAYVDFGTAHPHHYRDRFLRASKQAGDTHISDADVTRVVGFLRDALQAAVESGDLATPSVDMSAQALWASVHGLTSLLVTMEGFPFSPPKSLAEHTIDTLIAGLRRPAGTQRAAARLTFID